jgi:hypothetical protein
MISITNPKKSFRTEEVETLAASPNPSQGGGPNSNIPNKIGYNLNSLNTH